MDKQDYSRDIAKSQQNMMDRIPSLSLTGLSLSHHPLSSLQSQNLSSTTNSSSAALNQQALNSLNFHQQSNHNHHTQLNQNHLNHSIITSSNSVVQHHQNHHQQQQSQQQSQLHSTNFHHHQQLNGLLNNVGANGWVFSYSLILTFFCFLFHNKIFWKRHSFLIVPQFLVY